MQLLHVQQGQNSAVLIFGSTASLVLFWPCSSTSLSRSFPTNSPPSSFVVDVGFGVSCRVVHVTLSIPPHKSGGTEAPAFGWGEGGDHGVEKDRMSLHAPTEPSFHRPKRHPIAP
eukprot:scaffold644_cov357-Pavlova_lutheri.AAC.13